MSGPAERIPIESERGRLTHRKRRAEVSCGGENWIGHEMIADRLGHEAGFKMATDGVIDLPLEVAQVDRLGRNPAVTGGFLPRRDKLSRIRTPFDYDENRIHAKQ